MTLVPMPYIQPTTPELAFLYIVGMVIFLLVMLAFLFLLVHDEIWEK